MGKQVKTPRFYVDMPTFLHATGQLSWDGNKGGAELLYMNCANPFLEQNSSQTKFIIGENTSDNIKTSFPINFCALLNHNLASDSNPFSIHAKSGLNSSETDTITDSNIYSSNVINANTSGNKLSLAYNGSSIWLFNDTLDKYWRSFELYYSNTSDGSDPFDDYTHQLGSMVIGKYWDAPNSPDLSLTMSRRFDGIKKQKTIGGKTLANIYYDGATEWTMNHPNNGTYKYPPFELDSTAFVDSQGYRFDYRAKSGLGRKGLRSWNLTFSYISEDNMWMENEVSNTLTSDDVTPNDDIPNPMLTDDSFNFVWNCTLGGTLPFIFQPDNTNNNPDQFAICQLDQDSLNIKQVANGVYNISLKITEVW